jgi:hypothetical protein
MSDSQNFIGKSLIELLVILLGPFIGIFLLIWWIIASLFGWIFPKHTLFPLMRMYRKSSVWMKQQTGEEFSSYLIFFSTFLMFYKGAHLLIRLLKC